MIQNLANTTGFLHPYTPRHAAKPYAPRHAAAQPSMKERACAILRRMDCAMDKEMSGFSLGLCGAVMGLAFAPLLIFCYFA